MQLSKTMMFRVLLTTLLLSSLGCEHAAEPSPEPASDPIDWMVAHSSDYLGDRAWRRAELEASLWRPELPYARKRLAGYALETGGWDLLPQLDTRVAPVFPDSGASNFDARAEQLFDGQLPASRDEWLQTGERTFWWMPMRRDAYLEWVVTRPDLWSEVGLQTREDGSVRGLVQYRDGRGDIHVGATCGFCHGDQGIAGRATRELDLGKGRALFGEYHGQDNSEYATWGPGTVDVTDDGVVDALAIPDLWGAKHQTHLNGSGAVKIHSPASLAIRFETQYVVGHSLETRPPRELTWGLATYVLSLEPEEPSVPAVDSVGAEVFASRCAGCHVPERGFSGDLVSADVLSSDPQAAHSKLRGTGFYKTPSLIGISGGGPYLHDASAPTLAALVDDGHPYGPPVTGEERDALLAFLQTL